MHGAVWWVTHGVGAGGARLPPLLQAGAPGPRCGHPGQVPSGSGPGSVPAAVVLAEPFPAVPASQNFTSGLRSPRLVSAGRLCLRLVDIEQSWCDLRARTGWAQQVLLLSCSQQCPCAWGQGQSDLSSLRSWAPSLHHPSFGGDRGCRRGCGWAPCALRSSDVCSATSHRRCGKRLR